MTLDELALDYTSSVKDLNEKPNPFTPRGDSFPSRSPYLPGHIFLAYDEVSDQVQYMTITPDGRIVRAEDTDY